MADHWRVYNSSEVVSFLKVNEQYGRFGNFAPTLLLWDGMKFSSSEALYQCLKFKDVAVRNNISRLPAFQCKQAALKLTVRPDWETVKLPAMRLALYVKFNQCRDLKELLLSTGDAPIVEISYKDEFWGAAPVGNRFEGCNVLGRLLMERRQAIRDNALFMMDSRL